MSITVIVCTYNRCTTLAKALNSVAASVLPDSMEWDVIVVDNNSTDNTRGVIEDFCRSYPNRFKYLLETQQGVSYARNAGIRWSRNEVIAFMDDDVFVEPGWLGNLTQSLQSGEWVGAGGRIFPQWECSPPNWLTIGGPHLSGPFVAFDRGSEAGPLGEPPFGANMAFRRELFEKHGGFRTDLGRSGNKLLSNEDTEFGRRLLSNGVKLRYEPSAVMHHPVTKNRLQKRYLLAWWFGKGRADALESRIPEGTTRFFGGIPLHLFRSLAAWTFRWMIAVNSKTRFSCMLDIWNIAGQIVGSYETSSRARALLRSFIRHRN